VAEAPELKIVRVPGLALAAWEWPGADPPLVFAHGTGFHGRVWDLIARASPERRRLAIDFRGHGRSGKPGAPCTWRWFAEDVLAVAGALEVSAAVGIGHSMGGHALASAAASRPGFFSALLLIDPVILPPDRYGGEPADVSFILKRRARWHSPNEMYESFASRAPFRTWEPDVLRDYCEHALLRDGNGFTLACEPPFEASVYLASRAPDADIYSEIPKVAVPVTVMRACATPRSGIFDLAASPTWPKLASLFPNGRDFPLPGRNHYIPMERPDVVIAAIHGLMA
jgi:pimeloyl-ACP methyl ester carboxylesterase